MSRQARDPVSGSWMPIAGYPEIDDTLDKESTNPIQNQAVANPIEAIVNVYGSKNLLPNNATTQTVNGITFTVNSDGSVTASGSVAQGEDHATLNLFLTPTSIPAGFILTGCPAGGSDSTYRLDLTKATGTIVAIKDFGEGAVTTENLTYDYARIIIWEGAGNVNLTFYPMIRDARITDPTYVPYAMTNRELTDKVLSIKTVRFSQTVAVQANTAVNTDIDFAGNNVSTSSILLVQVTWSNSVDDVPQLLLQYMANANYINRIRHKWAVTQNVYFNITVLLY